MTARIEEFPLPSLNTLLTAAEPVRRLEAVVPPEMDGTTVDRALTRLIGISVTILRRAKLIDQGICLDGVRVRTNERVHAGQTVSIIVSDTVESLAAGWMLPCNEPLNIVYEDADLLVIDKPAGVVMYPDHRHPQVTIANRVLGHYARTGQRIDYHPIHRLDRGTSGLVLVAKHAHAQEVLSKQLHTNDFARQYLAICQGALAQDTGTIDAPIARVGEYCEHRFGVREDGKHAVTHYEVLQRSDDASLIRLQLETGRTHQIRVHMAHIGHPLVGDALYGSEGSDAALLRNCPDDAKRLLSLNHPALHSHAVQFTHPITRERMAFTSPLPDDLEALVQALFPA